ncbi:MAG: hypothetical protein J1E36_08450, partial [Eubacterium sp.]|nr:hypothetical protein [Eubacterium sp.]
NYRIFQEIEHIDDIAWSFMENDLIKLFKKGHFLITGYCGTWHGNMEGGKFINDYDDFISVLQHLNDFKIIDRNGHLIIEGSHHDGHDRYEVKRLTRKGYELANSYYFANDRKLHNTIMTTNFYSTLPKLGAAIYG